MAIQQSSSSYQLCLVHIQMLWFSTLNSKTDVIYSTCEIEHKQFIFFIILLKSMEWIIFHF